MNCDLIRKTPGAQALVDLLYLDYYENNKWKRTSDPESDQGRIMGADMKKAFVEYMEGGDPPIEPQHYKRPIYLR